MKNFLVFLFIFIFSPVAIVSGNIGKTEIGKSLELVNLKPIPKTVKDTIVNELSDWQTAECSYYDPLDSSQTKANPDGIGTSMRKIESGSIGFGSSFTKNFIRDSLYVFIQVKDCNIITPYGKGIFRVDDMMRGRYNKEGKFYIDFFHEDLSLKLKRQGRFSVEFRVYKIVETADSYS